MRILMLSPPASVRGPVPRHTPLLVEGLEALGCEVDLLPWGSRAPLEPVSRKIRDRVGDIGRARSRLRRRRFDAIVVKTAHDWATLSRDISLLWMTRGLAPRAVLQFHGSWTDRLVAPGHRLFKLMTARLLALSDGALVLSQEERRQLEAFCPSRRFACVRNPYDARSAASHDLGALRISLPRAPVLLFVGRIIEPKGVLDLMTALPEVLSSQRCHLLVVGDGADRRRAESIARVLGVESAVTFTGYLEGARLRAAYAQATAFVLPSWSEGFPYVLNEALEAGLPIVTTRLRGMQDHLEEGVNACLVEPRNPGMLSGAVRRLLADEALRRRMSVANRAKAQSFRPSSVAPEYLQALRTVMRDQDSGRPRVSIAG